ncbi:hypothetical protein N9L68_08525 [bacterium]|nr:hypothetical protein [bacterium]
MARIRLSQRSFMSDVDWLPKQVVTGLGCSVRMDVQCDVRTVGELKKLLDVQRLSRGRVESITSVPHMSMISDEGSEDIIENIEDVALEDRLYHFPKCGGRGAVISEYFKVDGGKTRLSWHANLWGCHGSDVFENQKRRLQNIGWLNAPCRSGETMEEFRLKYEENKADAYLEHAVRRGSPSPIGAGVVGLAASNLIAMHDDDAAEYRVQQDMGVDDTAAAALGTPSNYARDGETASLANTLDDGEDDAGEESMAETIDDDGELDVG